MEFKGTSGLWEFDNNCVSTKQKVIGNIVCESPSWSEASNANWKANAQLISKAPGMLEMLKETLSYLESFIIQEEAERMLNFKIKQLIEEATKID